MRSSRKAGLFYGVMIVLALGLIELALQAMCIVSRRVNWMLSPAGEVAIPDAQLEFRPNPLFPEHDDHGFRNDRVPAQAHAVALGDSQTYGVGVKAHEAWPARLQALTGKTVYSLAFSGYGPGHSVLLWPAAQQLRPTTVIEGFYSGNDLYDAYHLVHDRHVLSQLGTTNADELRRIREVETSDPLAAKINRLSPVGAGSRPPRRGAMELVSKYCRTYGLLRLVKRAVNSRSGGTGTSDEEEWRLTLARARQPDCPPGWEVVDTGRFKTVFRPDYRLAALDRDDPRIAEGWRISLASILELDRLAKTNGVRFLTLLIPTKELVFQNYWTNPVPAFQRLLQHEHAMWESTRAVLRINRVEFLDVLPVLRDQLAQGVQPYPVTEDGHPNRRGHEAIAAAVAARWAADVAGAGTGAKPAVPSASHPSTP